MLLKTKVKIGLIGAIFAVFFLFGISLAKAEGPTPQMGQMGQAPVQIYYINTSPQGGGGGCPSCQNYAQPSYGGSARGQMSQEDLMEKYKMIQQQQAREAAQARQRREEPSFLEKMATKLVPLAIAKYAMDIPIQGILSL